MLDVFHAGAQEVAVGNVVPNDEDVIGEPRHVISIIAHEEEVVDEEREIDGEERTRRDENGSQRRSTREVMSTPIERPVTKQDGSFYPRLPRYSFLDRHVLPIRLDVYIIVRKARLRSPL